MISDRTMACLFDLISGIDVANVLSILQSIGLRSYELQSYGATPTPHYKVQLRSALNRLKGDGRVNACAEVVSLRGTIRNMTSPRYTFDERWRRFERSLEVDGYGISDGTIVSEDPVSEQLITVEGSLADLLTKAKVPEAGELVRLIENSAEDFIKQPPDYTGCLMNVRTALETLLKALARSMQKKLREDKDTSKWGNALSYLTSKDFFSKKEEEILASIYSLLSEGHRPVRMTEEEMVRFARSLTLSACWLLGKKAIDLSG